MSIAKARRAAELVVSIQVEESGFAFSATLPFDVLLTVTDSARGIALRLIVERTRFRTAAVLAAVGTEVVMIGVTAVAFLSSDS